MTPLPQHLVSILLPLFALSWPAVRAIEETPARWRKDRPGEQP